MGPPSALQLREQLSEFFGVAVNSDDKLLDECVGICQMFNISPEDLFFKWEAMNFNAKNAFDARAAADLKQGIQREKERAADSQRRARASLAGAMGRGRGVGLFNMGMRGAAGVGLATPVKVEPGSASMTPSAKIPALFGGRSAVAGPSRVKFVGPQMSEEARKHRAYRYMFEKPHERSNALDERIDEFSVLFREHYRLEDEFSDPSLSTDEEVYVIGRITLDFESSGSVAKLNEPALTLEASRLSGSGARVSVRFDPDVKIRGGAEGAGGLGFFPGAIVALRGKNGGGGWFGASEILCPPPMKSPLAGSVKAEPFKLMIASGPFTPDSDLSYKPLRALLTQLSSTSPDVILLIGPFVDAAHPRIKDGDIDHSPAEMFNSVFADPVRDWLELHPGTRVLLVPSVRDVLSDHAVFPQSELAAALVAGDPRIHLLPNPCRFMLNGVTFAVTSVDVLFHLRKEEFVKRGAELESTFSPADDPGADSMASLARHVLRQRSLYPLFPVPHDLAHDVNLDVTHWDALALGADTDDPAPDVLVLPSRLKHFCKVADGTMAINPSAVTKAAYAVLSFAGGAVADAASVKDRISVEFLKVEDSAP